MARESDKRMKVAVDIDGVVANTSGMMIVRAKQIGIDLDFRQYRPTIIGVDDDEGVEKFVQDLVHIVLTYDIFRIKPYAKALKMLPLIRKDIGPITFITARKQEYIDDTNAWLSGYFKFPFKLIQKSSDEKPEFVKSNGFFAFIEDRLSTANKAAELGVLTYLHARQWNRGRPLHGGVKRRGNFNSIYKDLLLEKRRWQLKN